MATACENAPGGAASGPFPAPASGSGKGSYANFISKSSAPSGRSRERIARWNVYLLIQEQMGKNSEEKRAKKEKPRGGAKNEELEQETGTQKGEKSGSKNREF